MEQYLQVIFLRRTGVYTSAQMEHGSDSLVTFLAVGAEEGEEAEEAEAGSFVKDAVADMARM